MKPIKIKIELHLNIIRKNLYTNDIFKISLEQTLRNNDIRCFTISREPFYFPG